MDTFTSHSPGETFTLGEAWGREAPSGLVIGLCGDLGAGKTQLVKGLARGLDCGQQVRSPTFALVNAYSGGRLLLFHLDLYRLQTRDQIVAAGLDEYLKPEGVTVIEWADRWLEGPHSGVPGPPSIVRLAAQLGAGRLRWVRIDVLSERERRIAYEDTGV